MARLFWISRMFWQSYIKRRGDMPRIMDYADNVVPTYPLPVFKERFHLSRSTFETLTEMLTGCPEFT